MDSVLHMARRMRYGPAERFTVETYLKWRAAEDVFCALAKKQLGDSVSHGRLPHDFERDTRRRVQRFAAEARDDDLLLCALVMYDEPADTVECDVG